MLSTGIFTVELKVKMFAPDKLAINIPTLFREFQTDSHQDKLLWQHCKTRLLKVFVHQRHRPTHQRPRPTLKKLPWSGRLRPEKLAWNFSHGGKLNFETFQMFQSYSMHLARGDTGVLSQAAILSGQRDTLWCDTWQEPMASRRKTRAKIAHFVQETLMYFTSIWRVAGPEDQSSSVKFVISKPATNLTSKITR